MYTYMILHVYIVLYSTIRAFILLLHHPVLGRATALVQRCKLLHRGPWATCRVLSRDPPLSNQSGTPRPRHRILNKLEKLEVANGWSLKISSKGFYMFQFRFNNKKNKKKHTRQTAKGIDPWKEPTNAGNWEVFLIWWSFADTNVHCLVDCLVGLDTFFHQLQLNRGRQREVGIGQIWKTLNGLTVAKLTAGWC